MDGSNAHQLQGDPSKMSIDLKKRRSLQNIYAALPSLSIVPQEMIEAQKLKVQEEKEKFYYIHQLRYYLPFLASKIKCFQPFLVGVLQQTSIILVSRMTKWRKQV